MPPWIRTFWGKGWRADHQLHLAASLASLTETLPIAPKKGGSNIAKDIVDGARLQFREWTSAFRELAGSITIRFGAVDCFALCHTLRHSNETGEITAHWYRRALSFEPFVSIRPSMAEAAKLRNDSTLSTHQISRTILVLSIYWCRLALAEGRILGNPVYRDHGEVLRLERDKFNALLCGWTKTLSVLLGLSSAEYWTDATATSTVDETMFVRSMNSAVGSGSKAPSIGARHSWKHSHHLAGVASDKLPRAIEAPALADFLYEIYQEMFRNEDISWLASCR